MISTKPQTVTEIFFSSIRVYKKNWLALLPISLLLTSVRLIITIIENSAWPWVQQFILLIVLLDIFCFYWGICFVYGFLSKDEFNYKLSLKITAKRFLRAIIFPFVVIVFFVIGIFVEEAAGDFFSGEVFTGFLFGIVALIFVIYVSCVFIIYTMEILIEDHSVVFALKRASKIVFRIKNIMRGMGLFIIFLLFTLLVFVPAIILALLFAYICSKLLSITIGVILLAFMVGFIFLAMILIWTPVLLITLICFYNDLVIRFESRENLVTKL